MSTTPESPEIDRDSIGFKLAVAFRRATLAFGELNAELHAAREMELARLRRIRNERHRIWNERHARLKAFEAAVDEAAREPLG